MHTNEIPPELVQLLRELDSPTRARVEPRVARAVNACGCTSGSFGLLLGAIVSVLWWLTQRDGHMIMWPEFGVAAVAVLGSTMAFKAGGILFARMWLRWLRHSLMHRVEERSWRSV